MSKVFFYLAQSIERFFCVKPAIGEVTCACVEVLHFSSTDGFTSHRTRINKPSQAPLFQTNLVDGGYRVLVAPPPTLLSSSHFFWQPPLAAAAQTVDFHFFFLFSNLNFFPICVCVCVVTIFEMEMIFRPPHFLKWNKIFSYVFC